MAQRDPKKDAAIGVIAGLGAGIISSAITHPLDSHIVRVQNKMHPGYPAWQAPFKREMWKGVGGSAFKKGINYGISMGAMFAISSLIRNALDNHAMSKLGFHKSK